MPSLPWLGPPQAGPIMVWPADHPNGVIRARMRVLTMIRNGEEDAMADLIAIGYPDETTAYVAADEARKYGGTILKTSLSEQDEKELQDALHGSE